MQKRLVSLMLIVLLIISSVLFTFADSTYTVKPGDVLWKIAEKYNTTWENLAKVNNLKNPHLIYPNQVLKLENGQAVPAVSAAKSAEPSAPAPAVSNNYKAGTYKGVGQGIHGAIELTVKVDTNKILEINITKMGETAGLGDKAVQKVAEDIVKNQSLNVDTVTGATVSSNAVIDAVKNALKQASISKTDSESTAAMKPGKYTAEFRGYKANVKVETEVSADKILSVTVVKHKETNGLGSYAVAQLPEKIVKTQSVNIDTLSGATATSAAILTSVKDALKQAGADMDKFMVAPEAPKPQNIALDTDIVVIGAGGAGLTAGLEAERKGAKVIVVEKMDVPGGNTIRSSGAFNVAGHPIQVEANKGRFSVKDFIEYTMTGGHNINDINLVTYMIEKSASIVEWLRNVGFDPIIDETYSSFHVKDYASGLVVGLKDKFEAQGGTVMFGTKVNKILMNNGTAAGVVAQGPDGGTVTINAKAVIDAAGGFGANLDMVTKLDPSLKGFVTNNSPGATGDGIIMAEEVGAATRDMNEIQIHPTVHIPTATLVTEGCRNAGGILLNNAGKRFINECDYRDVVSAAILKQDQKFAYLVINQEIVDGNANIQGYYELGVLNKFDTIADMAAYMNVDKGVLQNTMDTWNGYVAAKKDPEFKSTFKFIRDLSKGPWYTVQISPGIHHTMGGIVINTNAEVISTKGDKIPGLFACGEVTGGVHGGNRVGGNAILDCLVFGSTAGDNAAEYVKTK